MYVYIYTYIYISVCIGRLLLCSFILSTYTDARDAYQQIIARMWRASWRLTCCVVCVCMSWSIETTRFAQSYCVHVVLTCTDTYIHTYIYTCSEAGSPVYVCWHSRYIWHQELSDRKLRTTHACMCLMCRELCTTHACMCLMCPIDEWMCL